MAASSQIIRGTENARSLTGAVTGAGTAAGTVTGTVGVTDILATLAAGTIAGFAFCAGITVVTFGAFIGRPTSRVCHVADFAVVGGIRIARVHAVIANLTSDWRAGHASDGAFAGFFSITGIPIITIHKRPIRLFCEHIANFTFIATVDYSVSHA